MVSVKFILEKVIANIYSTNVHNELGLKWKTTCLYIRLAMMISLKKKQITGDSFQSLEVNADLKLNGGTDAKFLAKLILKSLICKLQQDKTINFQVVGS